MLGAFPLVNFAEAEITGNVVATGIEPDIAATTATVSIRILDPDNVREYNLEINGNDKSIRLKEGDYVVLNILSDNDCVFNIPLLGIEAELEEGKAATLKFNAPPRGAYEFFCGDVKGKLKVRRKFFDLF